MAYSLFHLLFLLVLLTFSVLGQNNGTVNVNQSLTATAQASTPWLSPSGDFAFGFQQLQDKQLFLLSIWYYRIPDKTIVWYANENNPVPGGSEVELTAERGLVLRDPQGIELWSTSTSSGVAYGFLNDTGNFVLMQSDSAKLWDSFNYPTDTMLPSQIMETGGVLDSRQSETNFSQGRFQLRLLNDGNLVLNSRHVPTNFAYNAYYISGTFDPSNSMNSGYRVIFNTTGYMYILRRNNERFDLVEGEVQQASDFYHRATLNFDGVFSLYYHPKTFTGNPGWTAYRNVPENICQDLGTEMGTGVGSGVGSGACGYNSVCRLNGSNSRPICECPQGYSLLNPNDKYGSCKSSFTQSCEDGELSSAESLYSFVTLTDTDWPTSDYELFNTDREEDCVNSCLHDCFCAVAIHRAGRCWKKKLPLSNGRYLSSVNGKAFLKYRIGVLPAQRPSPRIPGAKKDQGTLIVVGSVLLGTSVFINFMLIGAACLGFFLIYHKKIIKLHPGKKVLETNLCSFTYKELAEATNGFQEELGRGSFGIVYKGVIQMGSSNVTVAVKKLDRVVEDAEKEFKTEVNAIGQTHHKNLVRLLGFCDEMQHRLLVYEYMSNGTLASFLFGNLRPSWNHRTKIALGVARGLSYLHEECSTQIIHCDIKPQNILLDEYYDARISDFGLAKLLMINQSQTNTAIRGTKGYVAPEWFRNTKVTAKVDVYSFGVLLLEIITCRRSLEDLEIGGERAILIDWVFDCFQEGKLDLLVECDVEALNDWQKLERFVMVGIWCVQEDPSKRPTIRKVSQMLEGVAAVTIPPSPYPPTTS